MNFYELRYWLKGSRKTNVHTSGGMEHIFVLQNNSMVTHHPISKTVLSWHLLSEKFLHISADCLSKRIKTILDKTFQGSNFSFQFYFELHHDILFQLPPISIIIYSLMTISNYNSHEVNTKIPNIAKRKKTTF